MASFPTTIRINNISSQTMTNFQQAFKNLRPVIISEGDRYKVTHKGVEISIPLSKQSKITSGFCR
jgi:predicted transcriptional regulator